MKFGESAWKLETGGWCETCSQTIRKSAFWYSYVSPNNGLNGFPKRSQFDANADTANAINFKIQTKFIFLIEKTTKKETISHFNLKQHLPATYFIRSTGSSCSAAQRNRRAYSMYSVIRWRKLSGSLNTTGIVILLNSFPIQFFKTDQMLNSLRENMGDGNDVLHTRHRNTKSMK